MVRQVSSTAFLTLLMGTFACIGFVLAIVMGRLGHSSYAWGLLGPIALLLALVEVRSERPWWTRLVASGDPGGGPVDVLVGIDGSPESAAATTAALDTIAAEDGYDLLVVGARGAGLSKVLLGSVASRLAARASVPVLVVGGRVRAGRGERKLHPVNQADPRP